MSDNAYFTGKTGSRYYYSDIADRIRNEVPQTLGKHISVQLEAIGLLEEMQHGTTPHGLPFTFAEAPSPSNTLSRSASNARPAATRTASASP